MTDVKAAGLSADQIRRTVFTGGSTGAITDPALRTELLDAVREDGIFIIENFPCDIGALVAFGREFGDLEPADPRRTDQSPDDPMDWIGGIGASKKKSWGNLLDLHTAAATAPVIPRLHMMLMLNHGFEVADRTADSGQSLLARVDDAIAKLYTDHGSETADAIVRVLETVPIALISSDDPPLWEPKIEPILLRRADGSWLLRYWTDVLKHAVRDGITGAELDAFVAFEAALKSTAARIELKLLTGDLIVVDNFRVLHGRRPFPTIRPDENGQPRRSSRLVHNVHVFAEL